MKKAAILTMTAAVLAAALPSAAQTTEWKIDPAHSQATFQVRHLMVTNVRGDFGKMSGTVQWNGKDFTTVQAEATIDVASINTREQKRDDHLRSPDFFDAATHPSITFKSKRAEPTGPGAFKLIGDLTIRGVTKEVVLDVEATDIVKDPRGGSRVGAQATTTVNRQDFGVKWNRTLDTGGVVVGDDVKITIDLALVGGAEKSE
jgi:polyisoprenoid-binding protein YceI